MKYKLLVLTAILSFDVNAMSDKFSTCKVMVMASSCNISRDKKAPPFIKVGGPASCFVGLDIIPKKSSKAAGMLKKIVSEEGYSRKEHSVKIAEIKKCLGNINDFLQCDIGFINAGGMKSIEACKF